jgi:hypothetical protein
MPDPMPIISVTTPKGNEPYYGNAHIGQEMLEVTREVEELVDVCRGR